MADPNTRQGKRTPVTLKIKFKSETLEQFIERYAVDVSQGGIFIRTKEPLAVGTQMKFEFQLRDASPLIAGEGTVVWTRENDPSRPAIAPGMGVRFDKLADGSQNVLERILAEKAKQAPARGGNDATTKPPMFTDTPTRVAPAPIQEALGVATGRVNTMRRREDSEQTPLPKPMPFHSDADDFDERAFEEATKVRSLEELAAHSAGLAAPADVNAPLGKRATTAPGVGPDDPTSTKVMPPDELAQRRQAGRADSTLADPPLAEPPETKSMPDRESAPGLPSPPEPARPPKMLDTTPSPRSEPSPRTSSPSVPPASTDEPAGKTKLGVEPAKAPTSRPSVAEGSAAPRAAIANEPSRPIAPKRPSSAPIVIGILVVVAAIAAGVYFFVLREPSSKKNEVADTTKPNPNPVGSAGSADVTDHGSAGSATVVDNGSAGSAAAMTGSAGSATTMAAGSNTATPAAKPVDTVIAANVPKATVEIEGTTQKGQVPFTAKLDKDQAYKARITAAGYVTQEVDVKGGQEKLVAKLVAKSKVLSITTEPAGADIFVDGVATSKLTPADVELTPAQAGRPRVRITLKRPGYVPYSSVVEASTYTDGETRMSAKLDAKLVVAPKVTPNTTTNNGAGSGATTPSGTGTGSATSSGGSTEGTSGGSQGGSTGTTGTTGTSGTSGTTTTPPPPPTPPAPAPSTGSGASAPGQSLQ